MKRRQASWLADWDGRGVHTAQLLCRSVRLNRPRYSGDYHGTLQLHNKELRSNASLKSRIIGMLVGRVHFRDTLSRLKTVLKFYLLPALVISPVESWTYL
ncbi:hypothetical protein Bbelb_167220 [Branchiostoma belcheri]|nr:hypothetical protein Bbelb_167220 [Branchiostoma belcheri]